ncbi:MAG: DUF2845 domain-containing protein [Desulfobacterales bacterium]|nr:DUF2845 domain-containing protein [Desulfobacterales bacterium]
MRTVLALWVVINIAAFSSDVWGRSMRCGGRLVMIGDWQHEVIAKCGEPQHVEADEDLPDEWRSMRYDFDEERFKAPYLLRSPIKREVWTYRRGPNRLAYDLYFFKGRLTRMEKGVQTKGADGR